MGFAGLRGTNSWGPDERPKSFREGILFYEPNGSAPLFALTSKMESKELRDPEHSWWEEKQLPVRLEINNIGGYGTGNTTLTVRAAGTGALGSRQLGAFAVKAGDLLLVEKAESLAYDNELLEVTASPSSDTSITVIRGAQGSTAANIPDGAFLTVIGSVYEEGTGAPGIASKNPVKLTNFTQIFKTVVGVTGTAEKTEARTGDAFKQDRRRGAYRHAQDIEMAMLFGRKYEVAGAQPKRSMAGLRSLITTNVGIFTTEPTEDQLINFLAPVFDFSGGGSTNERLIFCGNDFLLKLNKIFRQSSSTRINFERTASPVYGMDFTKFTIPQGSFLIKTHPLMNVHGRFTSSAFVVNPAAMKYGYLRGRDTTFVDHIETKDEDMHKGMWLTECTILVEGEMSFAYATLNYAI